MKIVRIALIATLIVTLGAATAWTWKMHDYPKIGIDDANIFFSYAENLASGNGMTYAANGERVEGFTSMMWMLLSSLMFMFGFDEFGVFLLSFTLFVSTQLIILAIIRGAAVKAGHGFPPYAGLYTALMLSAPSYITWMTITLMDTTLWGLIIAGMTFFVVYPPRSRRATLAAYIVFCIAPLVRPEALVVAPTFIMLIWLRSMSTCPSKLTRFCTICIMAFAAVAIGLTVFRVIYFGYPFPNTYYAKVSSSLAYNLKEEIDYFNRFMQGNLLFSLLTLAALIQLASWLGKILNSIFRYPANLFRIHISAGVALSSSSLVILIIPVLTGGDHFEMHRFFQPAVPLLCLATTVFFIEQRKIQIKPMTTLSNTDYWSSLIPKGIVGIVVGCLHMMQIHRGAPSAVSSQLHTSSELQLSAWLPVVNFPAFMKTCRHQALA